jgi:hypothetical protein
MISSFSLITESSVATSMCWFVARAQSHGDVASLRVRDAGGR